MAASLLRRRRVPLLFLLLALVVALPWGAHRLRGHALSEVVRVERAPLTRTVVATGRVASLARVEIGSLLLGQVASVEAEEGQAVRAGQVLVRLDDATLRAERERARAAVRRAEEAVRGVEEVQLPSSRQEVAVAEAQLAEARRTLTRQASLFERGMVSRSELDAAQRAFDVAQGRHDQARLAAEGRERGGSDRALADADLASARANLAAAEAALSRAVIRSPAEGVLIARSVEAGDVVQPGKTLLVLSRPGRTEVVAPVEERNLALLAVGQEAVVEADAFPGRAFSARVSTIVPAVASATGTVTVKLALPSPPPFLLPDMTVSAEVVVGRNPSALVLPAEVVRESPAGPWALAARGGRAVRVALGLGARGASRVEVLSGLAEGELVIPPAEKAKEGERIRLPAGAAGG